MSGEKSYHNWEKVPHYELCTALKTLSKEAVAEFCTTHDISRDELNDFKHPDRASHSYHKVFWPLIDFLADRIPNPSWTMADSYALSIRTTISIPTEGVITINPRCIKLQCLINIFLSSGGDQKLSKLKTPTLIIPPLHRTKDPALMQLGAKLLTQKGDLSLTFHTTTLRITEINGTSIESAWCHLGIRRRLNKSIRLLETKISESDSAGVTRAVESVRKSFPFRMYDCGQINDAVEILTGDTGELRYRACLAFLKSARDSFFPIH